MTTEITEIKIEDPANQLTIARNGTWLTLREGENEIVIPERFAPEISRALSKLSLDSSY